MASVEADSIVYESSATDEQIRNPFMKDKYYMLTMQTIMYIAPIRLYLKHKVFQILESGLIGKMLISNSQFSYTQQQPRMLLLLQH